MPDQLKNLYIEAREHNTAHARVAARDNRRSRRIAVLAAALAVLSGAAWTKLGGSLVSTQAAELVAAAAAFAAAIVSGVAAAMHWSDDAKAHTEAAGRWGVVRGDIEFARLLGHGNGGQPLTHEEIEKLQQDRNRAQEDEPILSAAALRKASNWLHENRAEIYS